MRPQPVMKTNICSCRSKLIIQSVIQAKLSLRQILNMHLKYDKELAKNNTYLFFVDKFSKLEFVLPKSEVEEGAIVAIATIIRAMHITLLTEAMCAQSVCMHIDMCKNVIKDLRDEKEKPATKPNKQNRANAKRTKKRKGVL